MFRIRKINNIKVNPTPIESVDPTKIKGYDLFEEIYVNIYMVAHKKSGKTTVIFKILKACANKDTRLLTFPSSLSDFLQSINTIIDNRCKFHSRISTFFE